MMRDLIVVMLIAALPGCISFTVEPKVETTKPWEGHFMSTNDFHRAVGGIELQEGESVWVLSNRTLSRVLKNVKEN
jgi:hypothetical protein